jgi:hypothetical protein
MSSAMHPASLVNGHSEVLSPGVKRPEPEADSLSPSDVVTNTWYFIQSVSLSLFLSDFVEVEWLGISALYSEGL